MLRSNLILAPIVITCGTLFTSSAFGANWQILRQPTDRDGGGYLQLDADSILREGSSVTFWTRAVYPEPISVPGIPNLKARVLVAQRNFDCSARTETLRKAIYLSDDSARIKMAEFGPYPKEDVIPGTPTEDLFNLICKGEKLPSSPPRRENESSRGSKSPAT